MERTRCSHCHDGLSTCGKPVDPLRAPGGSRHARARSCPTAARSARPQPRSQPVRVPVTTTAPRSRSRSLGEGEDEDAHAAGRSPGTKDLDSGPVIQVLHEPATGVVTSAADARAGRARPNPRAETDGAIQIADTGHIDDFVSYDEPTRSKALLVVALLVLLVLAAAAAGAYYLGYFDKYLKPDTAAPHVEDRRARRSPSPSSSTRRRRSRPSSRSQRAKTVLREQMKSNSPRVQRVAASALARTGDNEAIEQLAAALAKDEQRDRRSSTPHTRSRAAATSAALDALMAASSATHARSTSRGRPPARAARRQSARSACSRLARVLSSSGSASPSNSRTLAEPRAIKVLEKSARPTRRRRPTRKRARRSRSATPVVPTSHRRCTSCSPTVATTRSPPSRSPSCTTKPRGPCSSSSSTIRVAARAARRARYAGSHPTPTSHEQLAAARSPRSTANKDTEQIQIAEAILLLAGSAHLVGARMSRNLRLFYLVPAASDVVPLRPNFMLFQEGRGLSFFERLALGGIYSAA